AAALAALGDALLAAPDGPRAEARRHLRRAADAPAPPILTYLALGRLDLAEGDPAAARAWFERAAETARARRGPAAPPDDGAALPDALAGLADAELALGDLAAARRHLEAAGEAAPDRADLGAHLGDVLAAGGEQAEDPGEPRALVARGRSLLEAGELDQAEEVLRAALERDRGPDASLALAELELRRAPEAHRAARAAAWALRALGAAPGDERARAALREARGRELEVRAPRAPGDDPAALYELAEEARRIFVARPELADLGGEAARAGGDFDQPLLVTVMGEFSSGKSTFVNAFIGEDVAPTGITPTTATINVVKYGRERGGRVVHRDGRAVSLGWTELFERLRALDAAAARDVALVEILVPQESLARVNLVDTPGLNSILPEHEQVARGFIARADAVVWLFSAQQAGKASERTALRQLAGEGVRVLGVINKVDQLAARERAALVRHVAEELDGLVEEVVPLSARRAVETGGEDPAWRELSRLLEERFFA